MPQRYNISYRKLSENEAPFTKFGGQPSWISEPQWPLSKELGTPMRFICQIEIPVNTFPSGHGKVAYIFMTDGDEYVDGTWEAYGGENAVIIQDGGICDVDTKPLQSGQGDEFPNQDPDWKLLLQLDSCGQPFSLNFGDSGIGYVFVKSDCSEGRFLWQCC